MMGFHCSLFSPTTPTLTVLASSAWTGEIEINAAAAMAAAQIVLQSFIFYLFVVLNGRARAGPGRI